MKVYEWCGKDVYLYEDGECIHVCQALTPLLGIEITEALNEYEHAKTIKRRNDDRCARYKSCNVQFPLKKKVDY